MKIEVCANSYDSAINAEKAGADRIELCTELAVGGITPSYGTIQKVKEDLKLAVNVLIRPRSGDFSYSESEFDIMKRDISFCKELGCEGVVSGILLKDQTIDLKRLKELVDLVRPMSFTFHRAFDWVKNPLEELEKLKEMGVERILTSGQQSSAIEGLNLLEQMKEKAGQKLIILPGGGINRSNILQFKNAGFKEVHFSAVKLHKTNGRLKVSLNCDKLFRENQLVISDFNKIKEMVELVK